MTTDTTHTETYAWAPCDEHGQPGEWTAAPSEAAAREAVQTFPFGGMVQRDAPEGATWDYGAGYRDSIEAAIEASS